MRLVKLQETTPHPPAGHGGPEPHGHRHWAVAIAAGLVVAAAGTAMEYWLHTRAVPPPLVFLAPVTRGPVVATLRLTGVLEPTETRAITLPADGRATEVTVKVGDRVAPGQVLARFDPVAQRAEVARAESRLVAAEADSLRAELVLGRLLQRSSGEGSESEEAVVLAQARVATAAAEIDARIAAYRVAQRQLGDRLVRSPVAGVVVSRRVQPGDTVGAGAALMTIAAEPRHLKLVADAPEPALLHIIPGQAVQFTVPAHPGRAFEGRVASAGALEGPRGARRFPVVIDVSNEAGHLVFGMTATADIDTGAREPVFRVPLAALSFSPTSRGGDQPALWIGDARGSALVRTPVEVGASDGIFAEVRASGLSEGAMVAVAVGRTQR
jgi:RND family efflux transporter MFP subunit